MNTDDTGATASKSAAIIRADADLDQVVDSVRWDAFYHAGQICSALCRAIIHEDVYDELVEQLVTERTKMTREANPMTAGIGHLKS
ncbi:aldehyde dehydrogenase family protein [Mesorhizobium shangrilense]|uniref:Aldehyde dehydrogenase family protein n=1 Tax=Mesorhizobium shangrilense TaxID=460060 RepID=A0ABV2DPV8_9HYPH